MIVYRIAVDLFNKEFDSCRSLARNSYPICEEIGIESKQKNTNQENTQVTNYSIALFKNNILRFKALACESLFAKRPSQTDLLEDAIVDANEASDSEFQALNVYGIALAKF